MNLSVSFKFGFPAASGGTRDLREDKTECGRVAASEGPSFIHTTL